MEPRATSPASDTAAPQIICGMYAFTPRPRAGWQALFASLDQHLPAPGGGRWRLLLDDPPAWPRGPHIRHTCGYPYITGLHRDYRVACVPEFDVPGARGSEYSSWFVARANGGGEDGDLEAFRGATAVINTPDSNSGMNVLRHAVAPLAGGEAFFARVVVSGGHLDSLRQVIGGEADLAAIDAVSFHFAARDKLFDPGDVRVVGQSVFTRALPFVIPRDAALDAADLTRAFNRCLAEMDADTRRDLGITRFSPVTHEDYLGIGELERQAVEQGYPVLR